MHELSLTGQALRRQVGGRVDGIQGGQVILERSLVRLDGRQKLETHRKGRKEGRRRKWNASKQKHENRNVSVTLNSISH